MAACVSWVAVELGNSQIASRQFVFVFVFVQVDGKFFNLTAGLVVVVAPAVCEVAVVCATVGP